MWIDPSWPWLSHVWGSTNFIWTRSPGSSTRKKIVFSSTRSRSSLSALFFWSFPLEPTTPGARAKATVLGTNGAAVLTNCSVIVLETGWAMVLTDCGFAFTKDYTTALVFVDIFCIETLNFLTVKRWRRPEHYACTILAWLKEHFFCVLMKRWAFARIVRIWSLPINAVRWIGTGVSIMLCLVAITTGGLLWP